MIKPILISIGIVIICFLENIGHYFGFCFHGILSTIIGGLGVSLMGGALYLKNFKIWLNTRNDERPHKCKDHHHLDQTEESKAHSAKAKADSEEFAKFYLTNREEK